MRNQDWIEREMRPPSARGMMYYVEEGVLGVMGGGEGQRWLVTNRSGKPRALLNTYGRAPSVRSANLQLRSEICTLTCTPNPRLSRTGDGQRDALDEKPESWRTDTPSFAYRSPTDTELVRCSTESSQVPEDVKECMCFRSSPP